MDYSIPPDVTEQALRAYGKLHDGLSDMIEEGRLTEADIPDDYQWLVESLAELSAYWQKIDL